MEITGIGYIGLESNDAKSWAEYGPKVLGFGLGESRENDDGAVYLRMDDRHHRIVVRPGERPRMAYVGWEVADHYAFEEGLKALHDADHAVTVGDAALEELRGVHGVAQFKDPAGLDHEIFYGQWYDPGSFVPGRRLGGFMAEENGVGHVVLAVPELTPELRHFWHDTMGFRWFGHGMQKGIIEFYRARRNLESHNVGYMAIPGQPQLGLVHIGIYVNQLDDVGIAQDLVEEYGLPVHMTMGRHTQDPVVSFYSYTPDGMEIEYIWNDGSAFFPFDTFLEKRAQRISTWGHKLIDEHPPSTLLNVER